MPVIRIATRKSQLALWQSEYVAATILQHHPDAVIEYVLITSEGDKVLDKPLTEVGGKALFVKALEQALLDGVADIAVHSIKDMSAVLAADMNLVAMLPRADVRDAYCHAAHQPLDTLVAGSVIGTASPRRMCQIKHAYPHLQCALLRGNVQTRLQKLQSESYDAIILAAAGLVRMGLDGHITSHLPIQPYVPAIGQAAIGVECLVMRDDIIDLLRPLNHAPTERCVLIEREVNALLGGSCHVPLAAYSRIEQNALLLDVMVGTVDGERLDAHAQCGLDEDGIEMAHVVVEDLLSKGAATLLDR